MVPSINLEAAFEGLTDLWSPKVIARVNDQYIKVAKLRGEFIWHKHDAEDELFQVVRGRLRIHFEAGRETILEAGEICVVPRGVMHKPVADDECWVMLVETVTTQHTGEVKSDRTRTIEEQLA